MEITLQYFDDCPNWKIADAHLTTLISDRGLDTTLDYQLIDTPEAAVEHQFRGSPTVLIDGVDPFADSNAPIGLACRIYRTEQGPAGSPTLEQLEQAVASAAESDVTTW
jgi:hypothetical protein